MLAADILADAQSQVNNGNTDHKVLDIVCPHLTAFLKFRTCPSGLLSAEDRHKQCAEDDRAVNYV